MSIESDLARAHVLPEEPAGRPGPTPSPRRRRPPAPPAFPAPVRRAGVAWTLASAAVAAASGLLVDRPVGFTVLWVLTSGLVVVPALAVVLRLSVSVAASDRPFWRFWGGGLGGLCLMGVGVLVCVRLGRPSGLLVAVPAVVAVGSFALAIRMAVKVRSVGRSIAVDVLESAIAMVAVGAPVLLLLGDRVFDGDESWFTVGLAACLLFLVSVLWWSVVLFVRSPPGQRTSEGLGVVTAAAVLADVLLLVEQSASGFSLPFPPVLAVNGLCLGLLLVLPLFAPSSGMRRVDRLPPRARVRTGGVVAAITLAAVPVLVGLTVVVGRGAEWCVAFTAAALALLLVLATLRHLLSIAETRRLYGEVERLAESRRALLADLLQNVDGDRGRMTAQLHEQAASSYAAFASFVHSTQAPPVGVGVGGARSASLASDLLRARLAARAESLRELARVIQPTDPGSGHDGWATMVRAFVDSLYADELPPATEVDVDERVALDWVTETVSLRIVQEAIRNVWRHSGASRLRVSLASEDGVATVRVSDDGEGFDPAEVTRESGLAIMRTFVALADGELHLHSAPGEGTVVEARLGSPLEPPSRPPRLRLVGS